MASQEDARSLWINVRPPTFHIKRGCSFLRWTDRVPDSQPGWAVVVSCKKKTPPRQTSKVQLFTSAHLNLININYLRPKLRVNSFNFVKQIIILSSGDLTTFQFNRQYAPLQFYFPIYVILRIDVSKNIINWDKSTYFILMLRQCNFSKLRSSRTNWRVKRE